jgi:uncharacterized protein involved in exopolysaccharide biosynthesis
MTLPSPPLDTSAESTEEYRERHSGSGGLIQLMNLVARGFRTIVGFGMLAGLSVGLWTFSTPRTFTSKTSFVPQQTSQRAGGALAGVAAQFGISLGSSQSAVSPLFYTELLSSDELLRRIAGYTHSIQTDSALVTGVIADIYGLDYPTEEERLYEAIQILRRVSRITPSNISGVVVIEVTTVWPDLSMQIAQNYLDEVTRFNLEARQSEAIAERDFAEERLAESRVELVSAEDALGEFLRANRSISNSPELTLQRDRMDRRIMILQQVVASLSTAYQQARLDAVRNIPVISIIDQPRVPAVGNARGTITRTIVAASAGSIFILVLLLLKERFVVIKESGNPDLRELMEHLRSLSFRRR